MEMNPKLNDILIKNTFVNLAKKLAYIKYSVKGSTTLNKKVGKQMNSYFETGKLYTCFMQKLDKLYFTEYILKCIVKFRLT